MRKILLILPLCIALAAGFSAGAQQDSLRYDVRRPLPPSVRPLRPIEDYGKLMDTVQRWQFHVSLGATMVGNSHSMASLYGVSPTVVYRPNNRLKVVGSVAGVNSYSLAGGYAIRGREERSLTPYRYPSTALSATVAAEYQVSERLWLAASYSRVGGGVASWMLVDPWLLTDGGPLTLDASSFTAAMRYSFGNDSFLDIHLTLINDRAGTLVPLLYGPMGYYGYHNLEHNPFGYRLFQ